MHALAINTYIHLLSIITIFICLVLELIYLNPKLEWNKLLRILKIDGIYGIAAIVTVATGLLNWMKFGKGYDYYSNNQLFIIKFSLFVIVGLLSLYPTITFARHKKRNKKQPPELVEIASYSSLKKIILLELGIMSIIPLLATLMANGIGL